VSDITQLLDDYANGNRAVLDELLPLVLRRTSPLAHSYLANERQDITLQTTALGHEAYLKTHRPIDPLISKTGDSFFALSAQAMRRILLDNARSRNARKRWLWFWKVLA
jgi:hypothetical protein